MMDKFRVWYNDEAGALYIQTFERLNKEDVGDVMTAVDREFEGKDQRYVIVDLSRGSSDMVDKEARRAFRESARPEDFEKVAVFGASPAVRMLAKVIFVVTGVSNKTRFFKTEADALAWLKGE
jgi:hypothetical protein